MLISHYIKVNLAKGHSLDKIKKYLLAHNHSNTEINKAIAKVCEDYEENHFI